MKTSESHRLSAVFCRSLTSHAAICDYLLSHELIRHVFFLWIVLFTSRDTTEIFLWPTCCLFVTGQFCREGCITSPLFKLPWWGELKELCSSVVSYAVLFQCVIKSLITWTQRLASLNSKYFHYCFAYSARCVRNVFTRLTWINNIAIIIFASRRTSIALRVLKELFAAVIGLNRILPLVCGDLERETDSTDDRQCFST